MRLLLQMNQGNRERSGEVNMGGKKSEQENSMADGEWLNGVIPLGSSLRASANSGSWGNKNSPCHWRDERSTSHRRGGKTGGKTDR